MGKINVLALMFIWLAGFAVAASNLPLYSLDANYEIFANNSVKETLDFTFSSFINDSLVYEIDKNISDLSIEEGKNPLNYTLIDNGEKFLANITIAEPISKLVISYIDYVDVFEKDNVKLFYADFYFESVINKLNVMVTLPPGYSIHKEEYSNDATINSDGERITIKWAKTNILNTNSFFVTFFNANPEVESQIQGILINSDAEKKRFGFSMSLGVALVLLIIFGTIFYLFFIKSASKNEDSLLKGFKEDERKVILFLKENKDAWQNEIRYKFQFSRAKMTRIVKRLESQGIIKKENFGKTNKVYWIEKT